MVRAQILPKGTKRYQNPNKGLDAILFPLLALLAFRRHTPVHELGKLHSQDALNIFKQAIKHGRGVSALLDLIQDQFDGNFARSEC